MRRFVPPAALLGVAASAFAAPPQVDFGRDVRPILGSTCLACHGADDATRKANLRLDRPITAAQARAVARRIAAGDMPPPDSGRALKPEQKTTLKRWTDAGAPFAQHWAFVKPVRPIVPAPLPPTPYPSASEGRGSNLPKLPPRSPRGAGGVSRSPRGLGGAGSIGAPSIDALVRARLAQAGLKPSPEADRRTLIRRVSLDLIGLPPTPEDVDAFVKDARPDAYERIVDRLLASPRYGEHWARMWLDLARYADTKGYEKDQPRTIWRWRDWVIDAYNRDLPYDRFTIEQLAGDLLPDATDDQILATAFHRNTMTNDEGGTDDEEFRQVAVKDRIDTTGQVWMGLTVGCAKCHSHKYDPISQSDYYKFYALFNQTADADRYDDAPLRRTPSAEQRTQLDALEAKVKALEGAFWQPLPALADAQKRWETDLARTALWSVPAGDAPTATSGAAFARRGDGAWVASGKTATTDTYTLTVPLPATPTTSLRLEVLNDPSLPRSGPGRNAADQNAVVSELTAVHTDAVGKSTPIALVRARADFQQDGWPAANAIDGKPETGWAWAPRNGQSHVLLVDLKTPVAGGALTLTIAQNYPNLAVGCLRVSVSAAAPGLLTPETPTLADLAVLPNRTPDQQKRLDRAFRESHAPTAAIGRELAAAEKALRETERAIPQTPVVEELPESRRRVTKIHIRGNFLDPGETVTPAALPAFGPLPASAPLNRLGAAQWLVSPENPLTARVAVNRLWARLFGVGLVETEEDFGTQGALPTHPELLDALAIAYQTDFGWSQKKLLKAIVLSATYRQTSASDPARAARDPRNRLLWRGPRFRLSAEAIRDQALSAAGLLSAKLHGPSVMPPQPPGLWRTTYSTLRWETSPGEDRWRRGLYTFTRRTSPYPGLTTFDATSGEVCTLRRVRTNTPLQALVTLNDPAFVEAAAGLGRIMATSGLDAGFRRLLARPATPAESKRLRALFLSALADFRKSPGDAEKLLASANASPKPSEDAGILAAWTVVGNVLLNLDEALTKG